MFDLGQSDLKSHKSTSLSGVFWEAGEVCSFGDLWLAPAWQPGPLSALIIFQTQFNQGLLSAVKTPSQIKSNLFSKLFSYENKFSTNCLGMRQTYKTNSL